MIQSADQDLTVSGSHPTYAYMSVLALLNPGISTSALAFRYFRTALRGAWELAQRSVTAAREIKDLSRNSSVEVDNGIKLVSCAGQICPP
jgi:methyl-accepting chemotaxis protein